VHLPADGSIVFLRVIRRLVDASAVERLTLTGGYEIWVDEDGIAKELPPNPAATGLVSRHGLTVAIYGTVVMTRIDLSTGSTTPVTSPDLSATYAETRPAKLSEAGSAFRVNELRDAIRLYADGTLCLQAAAELLIAQDWLRRNDSARRFVTCHESLSDSRLLAIIDWQGLTTSLDAGRSTAQQGRNACRASLPASRKAPRSLPPKHSPASTTTTLNSWPRLSSKPPGDRISSSSRNPSS